MKQVTLFLLISLSLGGAAGCGGASGSGGSGGGGSTADDVAAASSVSNLPSLDVSDYDLTTASGTSALKIKDSHVPTGEFSMAGCESNRHKDEMIRMTKELESTQCMVKQAGELGVITVPTNSYAYYNFTPPDPEDFGGPPPALKKIEEGEDFGEREFERREMKARMGLFCEDDSGAPADLAADGSCPGTLRFKMDMCEDGSLSMEMRYAISDSNYTGTVVHQFRHGGDLEGQTEQGRITVDVDTTPTGTFDFSSALITGTFNGIFGEGAMSFAADADLLTNTVQGAFTSSFTDPSGNSVSNTGTIASRWEGTTGCAEFEGTGEFPAMSCPYEDWVPAEFQGQPCCILPPEERGEREQYAAPNENGNCEFHFADTEPFSIVLTDSVAGNWLVADTNAFCEEVGALEPLTAETISFSDNWDCLPPDGGSFDLPNFSAVDFSAGDPFEDCFEDQQFAEEGGRQSICMQDFGSEKRDEHREESFEGEGPDGPPPPLEMTLVSSSGCESNPMPASVNVFLSDDGFGMDADTNGDGKTEPIGGGRQSGGTLSATENGFNPNGGDFDDAHFACSGTVSETGLQVTNCEDGCSFSYAP